MFDLDFHIGIILLNARADRCRNAACNAVTAPGCRCVMDGILFTVGCKIDPLRLEYRSEFLKRDDKIDVAAHGAPARFELLGGAGSDKDDTGIGTELFDGTRGRYHRRKRAGNLVHHIGELQLCEHAPCGAAGREQERKFTRCDFRGIVMRLGRCADVCAVRNFIDFLETDIFERRLDLPERYVWAELTDDGRRNFRNDFVALFDRADQLEDLRLIGNRTERTADHALTAPDALFGIDARTPEAVARDRLYAARLRARTRSVRDRLVRASCLALAALDALVLVDDGFSRFSVHGDRALGTDRHAIARNTAAALIADFVLIFFASVACRRNDLHERRFVITVGNVARIQPVRDMGGTILRIERHTHRKADAFGGDGALTINALAVHRRLRRRDLVRDLFQIARHIFRFECNFCDLDEDLPSQLFDRSFQTSHSLLSSLLELYRNKGKVSPCPHPYFFVSYFFLRLERP